MAEIVNLREFRKKKNRQAKAVKAARNRALSGRGKPDKERDRAALERQETELDGKNFTPDDVGDGDGDGDA